MSLARFAAKRLPQKEVKRLVQCILDDFSGISGLEAIVLFGSAARGIMDECSDLDVVLILDSPASRDLVRKSLHLLRRKARWPMDILCTDRATFKRKSRIGGVFFVARDEGKVIFGEMP